VAGTIWDKYTGYCIPLAACGGSPLGTCEPATSPATPPSCPDGTIPGTIDGAHTGGREPRRAGRRGPVDGVPADPIHVLPTQQISTPRRGSSSVSKAAYRFFSYSDAMLVHRA
jgi:hypothetical protein